MGRSTALLADVMTGEIREHDLFSDHHSTTPHTHDPGGYFRYPPLGKLRDALERAYRAGDIGLPDDDEHRWCDEDSGGVHRFDVEMWLDDLAVSLEGE